MKSLVLSLFLLASPLALGQTTHCTSCVCSIGCDCTGCTGGVPSATPVPTVTPTPTRPPVLNPTPTPCIPQPGPGGIGGCPTPTPTRPPSGTPTSTPVATPVATPPLTPTPTAAATPTTSTSLPPSPGACSLSSVVQFEPNPPGVSRPQPPLSPGFSNALAIYRKGALGPRRLLMMESYGYSVLSLDNPSSPSALSYRALMSDGVTLGGDGQSIVYSFGISDDGQRVAFGLGNQADAWGTVAGPAATGSGEGFKLFASFAPARSTATVQHVGSRYLAYTFSNTSSAVTDVTILPATFTKFNTSGESTGWGGGGAPVIAGTFVVFQARGGTIKVYDASLPGPVGSIVAGYASTSISSADLIGSPTGFTALYDNGTLWVLVEVSTGATSPSFQLVAVTKGLFFGLNKSVKPAWRVPTTTTETWASTGNSPALVALNGQVYAFMFARRAVPSITFKLYATTVAAWPGTPTASDVASTGFALPGQIASFGSGGNAYLYVPSTNTATALTLGCR